MLSANAGGSLPVANYSTRIISDAAGSVFDPQNNSRVRINIPPSVAMVDPFNSYIQCDMKVNAPAEAGGAASGVNTFKMALSNSCGAEQIMRNIRITMDQRGVETVQNANVLEQFRRAYETDVATKGIDSVFSHGSDYVSQNPTPFVEAYDAEAGTMTMNNIATTQVLRPKTSGLLTSKTGLPLFLTGAMAIEWDLETSANVLEPVGSGIASSVPVDNITSSAGGEIGGATELLEVTLQQATDPKYAGYSWGSTNAEVLAGNPFAVGNVVIVTLENATLGAGTQTFYRRVNALTINGGNGKLQIQLDTAIGGLGNAVACTNLTIQAPLGYSGVSGVGGSTDKGALTASTQAYTYEISNVAYVARVIELPPAYRAGAARRVAQDGGFQMDVISWSNYVNNVLENVSVQSHLVPSYLSRVRSVISIPVAAAQTDYESDRGGAVGNVATYQSVIGNRREPQRPVSITNWTSDTVRQFPAQEHLAELVKALSAAGIDCKSLRAFRENFAMARSLSYQGSSESLMDRGYRVEMTHTSNVVSAKTLQTFVCFIRRLAVTLEQGLMVMD